MCGRYAAATRPEELVEEFEVDSATGPGPGEPAADAAPDWNVAPTKPAPVVLQRRPRGEDRERAEGTGAAVRRLRLLRWGLVPSWAKDPSVGARMINARAESLLDKAGFRRAAQVRRCLVPADGWYEWQVMPASAGGRARTVKRPHFVRAADGGHVAFAGLYEFWRDRGVADSDDPRAWLTTFTIVTTAAAPGIAHIHERMPLVLPRQAWDRWLDPDVTDLEVVSGLLRAPAVSLDAYPVSSDVNAVANNGPHLLLPVPEIDPATGEILADPGGDDALF